MNGMHARVVLLTVRMLTSHVYPHYSLDQEGFTPLLGLTLMQNLAQRGAQLLRWEWFWPHVWRARVLQNQYSDQQANDLHPTRRNFTREVGDRARMCMCSNSLP
jgi:hypothetical protein